jgi:aryl-alcohol dehydrogenase-like predicted oxidoreductase
VPPKKELQGRTDKYIGSWLAARNRKDVIVASKVERVAMVMMCTILGQSSGKSTIFASSKMSCSVNASVESLRQNIIQVSGYGERAAYTRDNDSVTRITPAQIEESVNKSLARLGTDYIDLLQVRLIGGSMDLCTRPY